MSEPLAKIVIFTALTALALIAASGYISADKAKNKKNKQ